MKKTMRYLRLVAFVAAGALLAGCVKEEQAENQEIEAEDVVVTLSTSVSLGNTSTKAVDANGVKTFAVGDQIAVFYPSGSSTARANSSPLTSVDISEDGKSATFTVTLVNHQDGTVRYVYPANKVNDSGVMNALSNQLGTLGSLSAFDYAEGSGTMTANVLPSISLANQLAVGVFTLMDNSGAADLSSIKSIDVYCGDDHYTISPSSSPIYLAMKPVENQAITFYAFDQTNHLKYWKRVSSVTLEANNFYPVSVTMGKPGVLPGEFSVSSGKTVHFSQGNLVADKQGDWTSYTWSFFEQQYSTSETNTTSISANYANRGGVSLFGWGTKTFPNNTSQNGEDYSWAEWGENAIRNGGNEIDSGWRTLTMAEWQYLLNRSDGTLYTKAQVGGAHGLILYPDGYTGTKNTTPTTDEWLRLVAAGCVFLPAAGGRNGTAVDTYAYSGYWTSTPQDGNVTSAAFLRLFESNSSIDFAYTSFASGYSVRLVMDSADAFPQPAPAVPVGAIDGKFTVNASGDQVYFSQGNLQYQASTDTWRFAEHQYDYAGNDNASMSETYSGWIDLYRWGTSGIDYTGHATLYRPWETSFDSSGINPYSSLTTNLYDGDGENAGKADWGYNAISNGGNTQNSGWRTLKNNTTDNEWQYIFNSRSTANEINSTSSARYTQATINTDDTPVNGIILLPDESIGTTPSGVTWGAINAASEWGTQCTTAGWAALEAAGCVFLPASGKGELTGGVSMVGSEGHYWSSSYAGSYWNSEYAYGMYFFSNYVSPQYSDARNYGLSVRLVKNVQ